MELISLWYLSSLRLCNFRCAYCASGQPLISDRKEWLNDSDLETHLKIMNWIGQLRSQVKLRINTVGEPFVSDSYLQSVAQLSKSENLALLEILTNGSFSESRLEKLAEQADVDKIHFWMTYHPSQIKLERFIKNAVLAKARGFHPIVHALVFPDTLESTLAAKKSCEENGLPFHLGFGLNFGNAYPERGFVPSLDEPEVPAWVWEGNVSFPDKVYKLAEKPYGQLCGAGSDYFFINPSGEVHRCFTYSNQGNMKPLGSVLDASFELPRRKEKFAKCEATARCVCTEDHQNLKVAKETFAPDLASFIPWSKKQFEGSSSST